MKNIKIDTNEVQRILFLHENYKNSLLTEGLNEQLKEKTREEVLKWFADAKRAGCLKDPNLNYNSVFKTKSDDGTFKYFIKGPSNSMQGKIKRVYDDYTVEILDPTTGNALKSSTWKCNTTPEVTQPLNSNQNKVLELLRPLNWSNTPKPTDVEVDSGLYEKMNLSDETTELGKLYSKYFSNDYPKETNGFYVYKKTVTQPNEPGKVERVEATAESCKTSIESLYNHMKSPNTYPIGDSTKRSYISTAQRCAEPANKRLFLLRFGLDKKLESIAPKYEIKLS